MSESSAPPAATTTEERQQQHPHQMQAQAAMSAGGASNTSNSSSRRAAASSAASSSNSASRATPATTLSARNAAAHLPPPPPPQQQQQGHPPPPPPPLLETLPSAETQRHIAEARAAVVASMGNMLDTELQGRAAILHENAGALDKQEQDVLAATDALRREREKLAREADAAARRLKEVGNVQNWAEVLERNFLVLEETVRLANGGGGDSDGYGSWSSRSRSGSVCSCSDCGRTLDGGMGGEGEGMEDGGKMDVDGGDGKEERVEDKGKGKEVDVAMDGLEVMSEASRSFFDGESSTADDTGRAKNSETASLSTSC
ncbi:GCN5-like 1 [Akanthomyces lecanii RCEF 1005]|uniref:Biogenesis of lysosome-related organelles complex 1 subunit 1 n=1 Tax=Akanthomyces lecanii RCEF 1005 TaxID=1081108 RepID=A0A168IGL6_CORDF|nr:GCN5-like 1 [Akanthomyces lecanii RCEF 1005]